MKSAADIHNLYKERKKGLDSAHAAMLELRGVIGGEMVIPLPEINESERPAVANLIAQTVDQKAMRIASTMPTVRCPERRPGIKRSEGLANTRRNLILGWWAEDRLPLKLRERARHAVAYDASVAMVRPDFTDGRPCWSVRDPASVLPAAIESGDLVPDDAILAHTLTYAKIARRWPEAAATINKTNLKPDEKFTILEYIDDLECVVVICGNDTHATSVGYHQGGVAVEATRYPNRAGRPLVVVSGRVHLGKTIPRLFQAIGMYQAQAQLFALELIGMQRSVWPETWFRDTENGTGKIVTMADPIRGTVGHVKGGEIAQFNPTPSPFGVSLANQLERNIRVQTSTPAEFGGESASNVRTGRRGDAILGATIDFELQEIQQMFEASLEEENRIAIAIDKAYFAGRKTVSFYSSSLGEMTYDTETTWETDDNRVIYSMAGVDQQELVIGGLQRVGAGTLSKDSFMAIDPLVEDAERERDRITVERLTEALLSGVQQRVANDPPFLKQAAELIRVVQTNKEELAEAYLRLDEEYRQAQAEQMAQQQGPPGLPGLPPGPEQQPGLAEPGPQIPPTADAQGNLTSLLQTLRMGQMAGIGPQGA